MARSVTKRMGWVQVLVYLLAHQLKMEIHATLARVLILRRKDFMCSLVDNIICTFLAPMRGFI